VRSALIVGLDSQIGDALARALRAQGVNVHGTRRRAGVERPETSHLDLAGPIADWQPPAVDCAFLCAAVTSIAACKRDPIVSQRVNVEAQVGVAERLIARGTRVVFLSTNLVFDGSRAMRLADEPTCPTTVYGSQKAEAEQRLLQLGERVSVLRLTKVLTTNHPLLCGWRGAMQRGEAIHPFSDVVLAPVAMHQVIEALALLGDGPGGIYQLSGDRDVSYAEVALAMGCEGRLVQPIAGADQYPSPPPAHTTLDVRGLRRLGVCVLTTDQMLEGLYAAMSSCDASARTSTI
jgi:dTDP-4-dehydrorhamnose reductase